jgi:hypothetical protein
MSEGKQVDPTSAVGTRAAVSRSRAGERGGLPCLGRSSAGLRRAAALLIVTGWGCGPSFSLGRDLDPSSSATSMGASGTTGTAPSDGTTTSDDSTLDWCPFVQPENTCFACICEHCGSEYADFQRADTAQGCPCSMDPQCWIDCSADTSVDDQAEALAAALELNACLATMCPSACGSGPLPTTSGSTTSGSTTFDPSSTSFETWTNTFDPSSATFETLTTGDPSSSTSQ